MKGKRFSEERIIGVLRENEAGAKVDDLCRRHGISTTTFYAWRKRCGGLEVSEVRRLRQLESIEAELEEVKKQLGRVWHFIIEERQHRRGRGLGPHRGTEGAQGESGERRRRGKGSAGGAATVLGQRRHHRRLRRGDERVPHDQRADRDQSLRPLFVKEIQVKPGRAAIIILDTYAG